MKMKERERSSGPLLKYKNEFGSVEASDVHPVSPLHSIELLPENGDTRSSLSARQD